MGLCYNLSQLFQTFFRFFAPDLAVPPVKSLRFINDLADNLSSLLESFIFPVYMLYKLVAVDCYQDIIWAIVFAILALVYWIETESVLMVYLFELG